MILTFHRPCRLRLILKTQAELDGLVRDLNLSKAESEPLGSRLEGWDLLDKNITVTLILHKCKQILKNVLFFHRQYKMCIRDSTSVVKKAFEMFFDAK